TKGLFGYFGNVNYFLAFDISEISKMPPELMCSWLPVFVTFLLASPSPARWYGLVWYGMDICFYLFVDDVLFFIEPIIFDALDSP
ncbi:hypothetical protein ACJX0J_026494, partial [Zea mays]